MNNIKENRKSGRKLMNCVWMAFFISFICALCWSCYSTLTTSVVVQIKYGVALLREHISRSKNGNYVRG